MSVRIKAMRKPEWLKAKIGHGPNRTRLSDIIVKRRLHTVCREALCPNMGECWENGRATLMILGGICTRRCGFCGVNSGKPGACDLDEPARVAEAVKAMGLRDVVITSVTRDDLPDGGAGVWAETIRYVHDAVPDIMLEVLVPDFGGADDSLNVVIRARPGIFGHNIETVPSLYAKVRPFARYDRSLRVIAAAHAHGLTTKTGFMAGLGESDNEIAGLMKDILATGCDILYMGQYLQPTKKHLPPARYVDPAEFEAYKKLGLAMGFKVVVAGPLVRSSYHSREQTDYINGLTHK